MLSYRNSSILSILFVVNLMGTAKFAFGQKLTIDSAVNIALRNNLSIKSEKLKVDYQQALIKSAPMLSPTSITGEFGQFNSIFFDHRFGISQGFSLPVLYQRQKNVLVEEWKAAALGATTKAAELKKAVAETFYELVFLRQKEQILLRTDSMYLAFQQQAELRLRQGETNILEKTTAAVQSAQQKLLLQQVAQEIKVFKLQFQLLLNTSGDFEPVASTEQQQAFQSNLALVDQHPSLQLLQQQKAVGLANTKLEQAKLLPELTLGYFNTSIRGVGADDVTYSGSNRFQSFQVGVGVPLFRAAQRAKINAAKVNERVVDMAYETHKQQLSQQLQAAWSQVESYREQLAYYAQSLQPNYAILRETADRQLKNGEINYLDWIQLMHQRNVGELNYLELRKGLQHALILVNYLTNQ